MMSQYKKIKAAHKDTFLFFRLGDFYEMFYEDALEASRLLQITLTARGKGENKVPMCGIPYHSANSYIAKLTKLGKKVAICEQLSDPSGNGIVDRGVIRVITPGTTLDENIIDGKSNNFLMAIVASGEGALTAHADITTGEFKETNAKNINELKNEIEKVSPSEIVIPATQKDTMLTITLKNTFPEIIFTPYEAEPATPVAAKPERFPDEASLNAKPFPATPAAETPDASGLLMEYLKSTQKSPLAHMNSAQKYEIAEYMPIDEATLKNLELLSTLRENKKEGSLLWVLDKTVTPMGGRMLKQILIHPLTNKTAIEERLSATDELVKNQNFISDLTEKMKYILDLERLLARLSLGQGNARDLLGLKNSLAAVPEIKNIVLNLSSNLFVSISSGIDPLDDLAGIIEKAVKEDPPHGITEGGLIKDNYNEEVDDLRKIMSEGKSYIHSIQEKEIARTKINNLKVRYNRVFGYYIEVSKGNLGKVPEDYIRKQTLVNAERYVTPELKEYEEKVLGANEKINALEYKIFLNLREKVVANIERIQRTAKNIALTDVICCFANTALINNYCRPEITQDGVIEIKDGRHPVVEKMTQNNMFVPNDTVLSNEANRLLLITGPNMGGKSTYLRQVALIVLMAHIGSFVPARGAKICMTDRIFTRVGASDNLVRGQSTFMVEMREAANILANSTQKSLVILDEIGRGTSTYDGLSIAWAITEYLHDKIKAKTLFATHYHELINLVSKLPSAANYSVAVKEQDGGVVFLYKILHGGVSRSYGIEVAKLAGLPAEIISRSNRILKDLEEGKTEHGAALPINQMGLFNANERIHSPIGDMHKKALDELREIDINSLTPLQALAKLDEVKRKLPTENA